MTLAGVGPEDVQWNNNNLVGRMVTAKEWEETPLQVV